MDILSSNETFLGVILTLNVLCLFAQNGNNFIFGILSELRSLLEEKLENEKSSVNTRLKQFEESDSYRRINSIANKASECTDSEAYNTASKICYDYTVSAKSLKVDLSSCYKTMDCIKAANEQYRAPFFTLLFGLVVFIVNIVCRWFTIGAVILILPGVWIFTILSCIYWVSIWTAFCRRNMSTSESISNQSWWKKVDNLIGPKCGTVAKTVVCAGFAISILLIVDLESISHFWQFVVVISLMLSLITIIGIWRLICCGVKGHYSVMHSVGHILAFMFYSTCLTVVYDCLGGKACDNLFQAAPALSDTITLFAMINGVIAPFILPYYKYTSSYNKALKSLDETKVRITQSIDKFISDYNQLALNFFSQYFNKKNEI